MNSIVVYTIGCPKCNQLEKKLQNCGFEYTLNTNKEEMKKLEMKTLPYMSVDGKLMNFSEAWKWITENRKDA